MKKMFLTIALSAFIAPVLAAETASLPTASAVVSAPVQKAAPESAEAIVKEVMREGQILKVMEKSMHQMLDGLGAMMPPALAADPAKKAEFDAMMKKIKAQMPSVITKMEKAVMPLFLKHYTVEDLKVQRDFYRSPLGKKSIEAMPKVMEAMSKLMMVMMNPAAPQAEPQKVDENDPFIKLVLEMMAVTKVQKMQDDGKTRALEEIDKLLAVVSADQKAALEAQRAMMKAMFDRSSKTMTPMMVDICTKSYTADDLKALIAFYKTKGGQKIIDVMPLIQADMGPIAQQIMQEVMMEIMGAPPAPLGPRA